MTPSPDFEKGRFEIFVCQDVAAAARNGSPYCNGAAEDHLLRGRHGDRGEGFRPPRDAAGDDGHARAHGGAGPAGPGQHVLPRPAAQQDPEITAEINKFKREIDQFHADNSQYAQLERKYESYIKEVRQLEGQLADYNLAMDKTRTGPTRPISPSIRRDSRRRTTTRSERWTTFSCGASRETSSCKSASRRSARFSVKRGKNRAACAAEAAGVPPARAEQRHGPAEGCSAGQELDQINHKVRNAEHELNRDHLRDEYHRLTNQVERLERERNTLEEEMRTANMDPEEQRKVLLAKVKEATRGSPAWKRSSAK